MTGLTGIVLEISGGTMLVLNGDGELQTLPSSAAGLAVGSSIVLPAEEPVAAWSPFAAWLPRIVAAVALVVLSLTGFGGWQFWLRQTVAVVAVDINPSLQLDVDRRGLVRHVTTLNEDGHRVADGVNLVGVPIDQVLVYIVDRSKALGYISSSHEALVMVTVVPLAREIPFDINALREPLGQHVAGTVVVTEAPREVIAEAREARVSINKLVVRNTLLQQGIDLAVSTLQAKSIRESLSTVGVRPADLLHVIPPQVKPTVPDNPSDTSGQLSPPNQSFPVQPPSGAGQTDGQGRDVGPSHQDPSGQQGASNQPPTQPEPTPALPAAEDHHGQSDGPKGGSPSGTPSQPHDSSSQAPTSGQSGTADDRLVDPERVDQQGPTGHDSPTDQHRGSESDHPLDHDSQPAEPNEGGNSGPGSQPDEPEKQEARTPDSTPTKPGTQPQPASPQKEASPPPEHKPEESHDTSDDTPESDRSHDRSSSSGRDGSTSGDTKIDD